MARNPKKDNIHVSGSTVTVTIPRSVSFDLKKIQRIQEELVTRLGHPGCYSGFDILFRTEREFSVNPESLKLQPQF